MRQEGVEHPFYDLTEFCRQIHHLIQNRTNGTLHHLSVHMQIHNRAPRRQDMGRKRSRQGYGVYVYFAYKIRR